MSIYDVTMKQYNGTDYDTLYPKDISQQILLNSAVIAGAIGLTNPNPNMADVARQLQININSFTELGTYTGTGNYGSSHKNSLTLPFVPKIVIIAGQYTNFVEYMIMVNGMTIASWSSNANSYNTVAWNDKTVTWYSTLSADIQLNTSGVTYYYFAIQ